MLNLCMKLNRQHQWKKMFSTRLVTFGLVFFLLLIGWFVAGEVVAHKELRSSTQLVQSRYEEALAKRDELQRILSVIESPEYIEAEAKRKLNMKKAGESVFVVGEGETERKSLLVQPREPEERAGDWFEFLGF